MNFRTKTKLSDIAIGFVDLVLLAFLIFDFGFRKFFELFEYKLVTLPLLMLALVGFNIYKLYAYKNYPTIYRNSKISLGVLISLIVLEIIVVIVNYGGSISHAYLETRYVIEYGLGVYFFIRLTFLLRKIYGLYYNPAILFVGSFAIIAVSGAFLLMLPSATKAGITFTDALFTATSATAVTGLIVVDTAKDFTTVGQTIIMVLMQIGGLGMLTFTSFFAYFFKSGSSFKEHLYMKDILGQAKLSSVMRMVFQIVVFSVILEIVGAILIYSSISDVKPVSDKAFFAVFHAISAFCNAGFSLASESIYDIRFRYNYSMQWVLMVLIVFGGLGYHIAYNVIQFLKRTVVNTFNKKRRTSVSRVINLNTKIVLITTVILIFGGAFFFLISEANTNLTEHRTVFGKFTAAMFSSITARTTGFSHVDMQAFTIPGLLVLIFLMWIGASPASTGGGIKTSTFALATLNILALARNKKHVEIGTRRIAPEAIQRAFAIMSISLACIGAGVLLLLIFNPEFTLMQIAFEAFSAFGTVGLSLGITPNLSEESKYVVIFLMFFGRIGMLNLLFGIMKRLHKTDYAYPEENILIN